MKVRIFLMLMIPAFLVISTAGIYFFEFILTGSVDSKFSSVFNSLWWTVVTFTTVGYGDIAPQTQLGQALASLAMIMGYATIAVPTGIISAEYTNITQKRNSLVCPGCSCEDHEDTADFCKLCGTKLD